MEDKVKFLLNELEKEMERLIYANPKCDYEHSYNHGVDKCLEIIESYKEDEGELELNMEKIKPEYEIDAKSVSEESE